MTVIEITFSAHKYLSFQKNQKVQVIIPQSMIDSSIKEVIYYQDEAAILSSSLYPRILP